jgi:hypothetical protein
MSSIVTHLVGQRTMAAGGARNAGSMCRQTASLESNVGLEICSVLLLRRSLVRVSLSH